MRSSTISFAFLVCPGSLAYSSEIVYASAFSSFLELVEPDNFSRPFVKTLYSFIENGANSEASVP